MDFFPLWLSLRVALLATLVTFFLGILAARLVAGMRRGRGFVDGLFTLPLVLPPTVVGFFLLVIFGKNGFIGSLLSQIGAPVVFTWGGAVIASTVVAFPLMYRTARGAFEQMDQNLLAAGRTLGMTEWSLFFKVMLPNSIPSIMAGMVLAFARALGEFGATIMIAGNIPGKTQTVSVAIYTAVQGGNWDVAYRWMLIIIGISFLTIVLMNIWSRQTDRFRKETQRGWR
jgi:molybdate transport system permease protein